MTNSPIPAGRPPRSTESATSRVTVRFTPEELAKLDADRGEKTRAGYVRGLVARKRRSRGATS